MITQTITPRHKPCLFKSGSNVIQFMVKWGKLVSESAMAQIGFILAGKDVLDKRKAMQAISL